MSRPRFAEPAGPGEAAPRIRVAILGSTGSIGRQTVDVLAALPDVFQVVGLAAGRDAATLAAQAVALRPRVVTMQDEAALAALAEHRLPDGVSMEPGPGALERIATRDDVDAVVVATGGVVGLGPTIAALRAGKVVATANKETLVMGGHLVMPLARELAARAAADEPGSPFASPLAWLRPIDSEHSAIWQCLVGEAPGAIERIWLTASGGPFLAASPEELAAVTPERALAHPTWRMGAKITIDSATMMNKGLEVVEANRLYDVPFDRISVAIHPQSIVHSAVEFVDGSVKAQLGRPDMRIPIQYALTFPSRRPSPAPRLAFDRLGELRFGAPDESRFPALRIAREAGIAGPRASAALIAADDIAVARFLGGTLDFPGIWGLVEAAVDRFGGAGGSEPDLEQLVAFDAEVRGWCHTRDMSRPAPRGGPR